MNRLIVPPPRRDRRDGAHSVDLFDFDPCGSKRTPFCSFGQFAPNNLKQLGLALHNYEASWRLLPMAYGGTTGDDPMRCNQGRLSPAVALLPFLEGKELWESIYSRYTNSLTGESFPSMGPVPTFDAIRYPPWSQRARYASMSGRLANVQRHETRPGDPDKPRRTSQH